MVFIAGDTSGINLGIAEGFAAGGAKVLEFHRDGGKADAPAAAILAKGGTVMPGRADVRDMQAIQTVLGRAAAELGPPGVVIAGAAGNFMAPAVGISANGCKTVIDIDLLGLTTYSGPRATWHVGRALPSSRSGRRSCAALARRPT